MSDQVYPCPVCGVPMDCGHDSIDGHITVEEWQDCIANHYHFHYWAGYTTINVGAEEFGYTYLDSLDVSNAVWDEVNLEIAKQRQVFDAEELLKLKEEH